MSNRTAQPLFAQALKTDWQSLPSQIHELHHFERIAEFQGFVDVERGKHPLAVLCLWLLPFPKDGIDIPIKVVKTRTPRGETWERFFPKKVFRTHLRLTGQKPRVSERYGPFRFELGLRARKGAIRLPVRQAWFLGIPIPKFLLPKSDAREYVAVGEFRFDVALYAPLNIGLIVRYRGFLAPTTEDTPKTH